LKNIIVTNVLKAAIRGLIKPIFGPPWPYAVQRFWLEFMSSSSMTPKGTDVRPCIMNGVSAERVTNSNVAPQNNQTVILYLHGGAYCICSPKTHRGLTAALAYTVNATVYVPDYRLAPENPFPAGIDDCVASYQWLLDQGYSAERIIIAGDSAGAGLAMATALRIRDLTLASPAGLVLLSPWVDLTLENRSICDDGIDPMLRWSNLEAGVEAYLQGADPRDSLVSAVFSDLSELPPMLIQVGSEEILLSDAKRLKTQADESHVPVSMTVYEKAWHVFQLQAGVFEQANKAVDEIAQFIASTNIKN